MPQYLSHIEYKKVKSQMTPANIKAALEKDPGNVSLWRLLEDRSSTPSEETVKAMLAMDLAKEQPWVVLDALSMRARFLFWDAEQVEAALDLIEKGMSFLRACPPDKLVNEPVQLWWVYGAALAKKSRTEEAKAAYETALREISLVDGSWRKLSKQDMTMGNYFCFRLADLETTIEAKQKHWRRAINYMHEAIFKDFRAKQDTWYNLACAWSLLEKKVPCFEAAAIALALGKHPAHFKNNSDFDFVRNEPEFQDFLKNQKKENASNYFLAADENQATMHRNYLDHRIAEAATPEEAERLKLIRVRYDLAPRLGKLIIDGFPEDKDHPQQQEILTCLEQGQWRGDFYAYDFTNGGQVKPLLHICHRKNEASLRLLLKRGMSPSAHGYAGPLVLMDEDSIQSRQLFEILLDHGLDVNATPLRLELALGGNVAESLLIHAIRESNVQIACLLVERGARISDRTWDGFTAVELATQNQLGRVLKAMESSGQPIDNKTRQAMGRVVPKTSDRVYLFKYAPEDAEPTPHYVYDPNPDQYLDGTKISSCGLGACHLLSLDLTAFDAFPEEVKRWKTYHALVSSLWCEQCDGPLKEQQILVRTPEGLLHPVGAEQEESLECDADEQFERSVSLRYLAIDREIASDTFDPDTRDEDSPYSLSNRGESSIRIGGVPRWAQNPEWPEEDGETYFFIGQMLDRETCDTIFFFLEVETGKQVIVHQMT